MKGHKVTMIKIIALIGKSGAGKDTLLKRVLAKHPEYNNLISYTTRPPRSNEVHGRDYYFIDVPTFEEASLVITCKNLYKQELKPDCFIVPSLDEKNYPNKDYHTLYFAEITGIFSNH